MNLHPSIHTEYTVGGGSVSACLPWYLRRELFVPSICPVLSPGVRRLNSILIVLTATERGGCAWLVWQVITTAMEGISSRCRHSDGAGADGGSPHPAPGASSVHSDLLGVCVCGLVCDPCLWVNVCGSMMKKHPFEMSSPTYQAFRTAIFIWELIIQLYIKYCMYCGRTWK